MSSDFRIGTGFDVHAFGDGDHVVLAGVRIAHERGLLAHSDGDVVIHALCDAMLGALALGDIGVHFPPSDLRWKDADSRTFLRHCDALLRERPDASLEEIRETLSGHLCRCTGYAPIMKAALAAQKRLRGDKIQEKSKGESHA